MNGDLPGETTDRIQLPVSPRSKWIDRAGILEGEIAASTAPVRRRVLWTELGRIQEQYLAEPELAERSYVEALAVGPDRGAAMGLWRLATARGDWATAASALASLSPLRLSAAHRHEIDLLERALQRRLGAAPQADTRDPMDVLLGAAPLEPSVVAAAATQVAAGTIDRRFGAAVCVRASHDLRLAGELDLAEAALGGALRALPEDEAILDAAGRLQRDEGNWGPFVESLLGRARVRPTLAGPLWTAAAAVLRTVLDRPADAARLLEMVPAPEGDTIALARALTASQAGRPLVAARGLAELARRSAGVFLPTTLLVAAAEAARQGREVEESVQLLEECGLSASGFVHRRIAQGLEELGQWARLVTHLDKAPGGDPSSAFWRVRAAVISLTHLADRPASEALLVSSRRLAPTAMGAVHLEVLLRASERPRELDALLREDASTSPSLQAWRRLWLRRSAVLDSEADVPALLAALGDEPAACWMRQTVLHEQGRWAALAEALATEAADPARRVAVAYRLVRARQTIDAGDDIARDLGEHLAPDDDDRLLGRLHERLCYTSGHLAGLIDRWVARLDARPEQTELRARLGLVCLLVGGPLARESSPDAATRGAASQVALMCLNGLRDVPETWRAVRPLALLAAVGTGSWQEVLDQVVDEVEAAPPAAAFWPLLTAAEIAELRLEDPAAAIRHLERAQAIRPGTAVVLRLLLRLYRRQARWTELESLLLSQARARSSAPDLLDTSPLPWLARLAMLDLELRQDDDRALSTCRAILRDHPSFAPALRGVERLLVPRQLFGELADVYLAAAGAVDGVERRVCLGAALDAAALGDRHDGPFESAEALLRDLGDDASPDRATVRRLAEIPSASTEGAAQRAGVLARCVERGGSPLDRVLWLTQMSEECRLAGDGARAATAARAGARSSEAAAMVPLLALAHSHATRAASDPEAAILLADVLQELGTRARHPDTRLEALAAAARLYHSDPAHQAEAQRCAQAVLEIDPKNPDALGRLIALRTERMEWRELCADLARVVGSAPEAPDTIVLLEQMTVVLRDKLGMLEEALEACQAILARNPRHATALGWLAQMHAARRAWPEAALAYEKHLEVVTDESARRESMRALAALYHDRVANPTRAIAALELLAAAEPDEIDHLRRLSQIQFNARNWGAAEAITRRLAEKEALGPDRIEAHLRLAQIRERGLGDPQGAVEHYRRALEIDPLRESTVNDLCACLQRSGDLRGIGVYRRQFTAALREGLYAQPTRIQWYRRMAENLASRGLDLACELVTSMIDWLESHGASGRSGRLRILDGESLIGVLRALEVPSWAITLLPELEVHLLEEHEWQPRKAGVKRTDRITDLEGHPIRDRAFKIARLLGLERIEVYLFPVTPGLIRAPIAREPTLVVSPEIEGLSEAVCRFTLTSAILRIRAGMRLADAFSPEAMGVLFAAITAAIDPQALPGDQPAPDPAIVRRLTRSIPKHRRTEVALALRECWASGTPVAEVTARIERALAAAAASVCGSLAAGVEALARAAPGHRQFDTVPEAVQLVRDTLSEDFLSVVD